ncbi:MAG: twin-arginine translocase TatA/TatE family subunit [Acidobacteria bacterium]|nr:MAG: twin-arginine translocase TatA/TatE family subunit [Acidobacteriota bacterium]
MFGTLGGPELFLILLIALIVFGPRKLPEIGKSMGKMMAEFRKASNEFRQTIESEVEAEKIREATRIDLPRFDSTPPAASPAPTAPAPETHPATPAGEPAASAPVPAAPAGAPVSREATAAPVEPK